MVTEQGLHLNAQPQTMAEVEQVLLRGDLYGSLVSFILTGIQEGHTQQTIQGRKLKLSQFVRFAKEKLSITDPKKITSNHIKMFLANKQTNCNGTTVNNHYRELHRFFAYLKDEKIVEETPMLTMHPPRKPKYIIKPFNHDQISVLLAMCNDETFLGARNRAIILVFMDTGLRLSELANIQLSDVNIQRDVITVMGKGNKERVVPFCKVTKAALLKYQKFRNSELPGLWLTEERRPLTVRGVEITIIRLGKYAGLSGVRCSPHTFRHYFGTNSLLNGAPDWAVQQLLGHATLDMTKKYRETINSENAVSFHRGNSQSKGFSPVERYFQK
jgi:integrase/recombinase XerC